jgi:hypothetical protein
VTNDSDQKEEIPLGQLLDYCTNPTSRYWNSSWTLFIKRYKVIITGIVINRCRSWNIALLKKQFPEVVNDILSRIFAVFVENDYALLKRYRARDNDYQFLAYLVTICDRTTRSYILEFFHDSLSENKREPIEQYIQNLEQDQSWELYEMLVAELRKSSGTRKKNTERDIHLFMMYIWGDFSTVILQKQKFYASLGERVFDLVISRMRQILKNNNFLNLS